MELRSQIIELNIPDDSGKPIRYYTYDGYLEHRDRVSIRKKRKDIEKDTFTSAFLIGWVAYYTSRKSQLPDLRHKKWALPMKGLLSGSFAFVGAYLFFDHIGTQHINQFQTSVAQNSKHLPLWSHKNLAVNPDRAYFQLLDNNNDQISIFHSGLTPQAAEKILPDRRIGDVPQKPNNSHKN